jgi:hypothetical protein
MNPIFPFKTEIIIPLRERDDKFMKIQELIEIKRNLLYDKQKKLKQMRKQNQFLDLIKDDYNNYNNYIQQQKRDQIKALELLNKYIEDLTQSGKLTENNIEDARQEQKNILREVKNIKNGLDDIIDNIK